MNCDENHVKFKKGFWMVLGYTILNYNKARWGVQGNKNTSSSDLYSRFWLWYVFRVRLPRALAEGQARRPS